MIKRKTRDIILVIISILILTVGLFFYINYNIKMLMLDYETKISELNQQTAKNLQNLQQNLKNQIGNLGSNLSSQIGFVDTNLKNFKKQNQQELNTLSNLIDQIEQQSNIKLNELKDELKNIKIQSADFSAILPTLSIKSLHSKPRKLCLTFSDLSIK